MCDATWSFLTSIWHAIRLISTSMFYLYLFQMGEWEPAFSLIVSFSFVEASKPPSKPPKPYDWYGIDERKFETMIYFILIWKGLYGSFGTLSHCHIKGYVSCFFHVKSIYVREVAFELERNSSFGKGIIRVSISQWIWICSNYGDLLNNFLFVDFSQLSHKSVCGP